MSSDSAAINVEKWRQWVNAGCVWTVPIAHNEFQDFLHGDGDLVLATQAPIPREWYMPLKGKQVVGLACGGGQQVPYLIAQGAIVTVCDICPEQLGIEQELAIREGYEVSCIECDISEGLPFDNEIFDLAINPVSVSYIEEVENVWRECFRILKPGGVLLTAFPNPDIYSLELDNETCVLRRPLPFSPKDLREDDARIRLIKTDGMQFSHSLEKLIGGQTSAGFSIVGFLEDRHFSCDHDMNYDTFIGAVASKSAKYIPTYFLTRAIKPERRRI